MIKQIDGHDWFCCPVCGKKIHPVLPGAYGVLVKCSGRTREGQRCSWSGEIKYNEPLSR